MNEETKNPSKIDVEVDECQNCDSCDMTLKSTQELHLHIKHVHNGAKSYRCDMCEDVFSQMSSLELHISNVHLRSQRLFLVLESEGTNK